MLTLSTPHIQFYNSTKHNVEKKKNKTNKTGVILCFLHPGFLYFSFFNTALRTFLLHNFLI